MRFLTTLALSASAALAQQYQGDIISASLPTVPGAEVAFFKIADPSGQNDDVTLVNYYSHGTDGGRIVESKIQRAVIVIAGLQRDCNNYENDMLNSLKVATAADANINVDTVAVISPCFPNGNDKNYMYPWTDGLAAGQGSQSSALVWSGSQWSAGATNQYPRSSRNISSFDVLDQLIAYYDDATLFPNLKQIVLAGHSMGGQMLQRYAAVSQASFTRPVTYWIGNPDSYAWLSTDRPLSTAECDTYDEYRAGYTDYASYGGTLDYSGALVASGRDAILANFQTKQIAYARALLDHGDHSSDCGANTTGASRHERFFYYISAFPPSCEDSTSANCDTVDLINVSHDNGQMFNSPAGQARLFHDNFYGDGSRAYDFGYPRAQAGDDPFPDPAQEGTSGVTINGNWNGWTYQGCWTDQQPKTAAALETLLYDNAGNSIEGCTSGCQGAGWAIAGLQNGSQCFCGNALRGESAVAVVDSTCRLACPGNGAEMCGGASRLSVFSAAYPVFQ
ncbi:Putative carbohydrate-binding WSC, alpha/Beta hydrolase [Septoria linicola]|uniref:Carbohydrate-binding WSC, alpha/Beta hydrolase n=1 Tax=Septoria linicola TaxID=215465 RepID=A0A9Q9EKR9_9PEZI|nr:putative carbohydrate-binding WSC, alpha/Beta hydrolase [Septoria linicola]USW53564.1 Putative carbohydrate-binding WSC, alpha/Beta hydrolase [Septoria linicola]